LSLRERLHPQVSRAEIEVFKALSGLGLTQGLVTQKLLILKFTIPDFCWIEKRKVVYLDGRQVHSSDKAQQRDEEIDSLLELQGWSVLRIVYDPPLTGEKLRQVVAQIRDFLGGAE
jgi:very-short-patch-repair endonuclease